MHELSTYGSWILGAALFMILGYMMASLINGKKAPSNPWGALTLEWTHAAALPHPHNFLATPIVVRGPYDYHLAREMFELVPSGDGKDGEVIPGVEASEPDGRPEEA